jgi:hypothetical protein
MLRLLIAATLLIASTAFATPVTFTFHTMVDATAIGRGDNVPLVVTYTFDSNLVNGTGSFGTNSYAPVSMKLSLDGRTVTGSGGSIFMWDQAGSDGYDVRAENFSALLFGRKLTFFRFLIVDQQSTMFDGITLPVQPGFAAAGDFQQTEIVFADDSSVGVSEFDNTPASEKRPFTLTIGTKPPPPLTTLEGRYAGTIKHTTEVAGASASAVSTSKVTGRIGADGLGFFFRPELPVVTAKFASDGTVQAELSPAEGAVSGNISLNGRTLSFTVTTVTPVEGELASFQQHDSYAFRLVRVGD